MKLRMDIQNTSRVTWFINVILATNYLVQPYKDVSPMEHGVETHQCVYKKVRQVTSSDLHCDQLIYILYISSIGSLRKDGIEVLHCPELSAPKQGTIKIQIKAGLFIAEHECMAGHKLLGNHLRFCIPTTGQWSGSAPTCQPCELMTLYIMNHSISYN